MKLARPCTETAAAFAPRRQEDLTSLVLHGALACWNRQRPADGGLPRAGDFDILDYRRVVGHINLVEVREPPLDFVFRVHSVAGADYVGLDMTGRSVWDYPDSHYAAFLREVFRHTKREGRAQFAVENVFVRRRSTSYDSPYRWEAAVMPLAGDDGQVARLVFAFDLLRTA